MQCPHCNSDDLHGPVHDFWGVICVDCGGVLIMDKSRKLDRDVIAQVILDSIYDGDQSYRDVAIDCADSIIAALAVGVDS